MKFLGCYETTWLHAKCVFEIYENENKGRCYVLVRILPKSRNYTKFKEGSHEISRPLRNYLATCKMRLRDFRKQKQGPRLCFVRILPRSRKCTKKPYKYTKNILKRPRNGGDGTSIDTNVDTTEFTIYCTACMHFTVDLQCHSQTLRCCTPPYPTCL
jgi:hypothetical protein